VDELKKALLAEPLSRAEAQALMRRIMAGDLTPVQTAGVLMALRTRGETPEEIAGFAAGMREAAVRVETQRQPLLDIVGTGGVARRLSTSPPPPALWWLQAGWRWLNTATGQLPLSRARSI
jgi:anthranilate phosphoribosyltransferase